MITINSDYTFIQVKSDNLGIFALQNRPVPEVVEMAVQHQTPKKSSALAMTKREEKLHERKERLDNLLLNAVDETLKEVFKGAGAEVIYNFMENKCHLKREEIAEKPEDFSADLKSLMVSAASVIEKMILENLYSKLRLEFEEKEDYGFSDYLKELRERCRC